MCFNRSVFRAILSTAVVCLACAFCPGQAPPSANASPNAVTANPRTFEETFPTPLLRAIALKDQSAVRRLLPHREPGFGSQSGHDYTKIPLLLAAVEGNTEIVRMLLDAGANIEARGDMRMSALMFATLKGNLEAVELLLQRGARTDAQSDIGATALMTAARDNQIEIVKALIVAGADVNAVTDKGFTALMAAGDVPALVELLLKAGAKTDALNAEGLSAACFARRLNQSKKLAALLARDPQACSGCK
jgi:ankyrin repeat protein